MNAVKRLEKILLQLERLQTPFNRLRRQLAYLKKEDPWETNNVATLETALDNFEGDAAHFRKEVLCGYGQIAPGRAELAKRFTSNSK